MRSKQHSSPGIVHDCMCSLVFGTTVIQGAEFIQTQQTAFIYGETTAMGIIALSNFASQWTHTN